MLAWLRRYGRVFIHAGINISFYCSALRRAPSVICVSKCESSARMQARTAYAEARGILDEI